MEAIISSNLTIKTLKEQQIMPQLRKENIEVCTER